MEKSNIVVVKKDTLFGNEYFDGYKDGTNLDYYNTILNNYELKERASAEIDPNYKQPIAYSLIRYKDGYLCYRRSNKENDYKEKRLHNKWSMGIGGHIEEVDLHFSQEKSMNFIEGSLCREIVEELGLYLTNYKLIGYINDDSNDVGKVHFGLLYEASISSEEALNYLGVGTKHIGSEILEANFLDKDDLKLFIESNYSNIETWSLIAYQNFISK